MFRLFRSIKDRMRKNRSRRLQSKHGDQVRDLINFVQYYDIFVSQIDRF